MNFELSENQRLFQSTLRRSLANESSGQTLAELGIYALMLPSEHGGLDGNSIDAMILAEEFGRAVAENRFVDSCVVAARAIAKFASESQQQEWLPSIADGSMSVALAIAEPESVAMSDHGRLSGVKRVVTGARAAQKMLVAVGEKAGISLVLIDAASPGIRMTEWIAIDGQPAATVSFDGVDTAGVVLGRRGEARPVLDDAFEHGVVAQCAEAIGLMATLIDATITQLNTRHQFGVPLAQFQALQHRLADMYMAYHLARSICIKASILCGQPAGRERSLAVAAAKIETSRAAQLVGREAIQMHGAMGVTEELVVGHAVKRIVALAVRFGNADHYLRRYDAVRKSEVAA